MASLCECCLRPPSSLLGATRGLGRLPGRRLLLPGGARVEQRPTASTPFLIWSHLGGRAANGAAFQFHAEHSSSPTRSHVIIRPQRENLYSTGG
eukprot:10230278-Alexandrium_andersonii.AAC.1